MTLRRGVDLLDGDVGVREEGGGRILIGELGLQLGRGGGGGGAVAHLDLDGDLDRRRHDRHTDRLDVHAGLRGERLRNLPLLIVVVVADVARRRELGRDDRRVRRRRRRRHGVARAFVLAGAADVVARPSLGEPSILGHRRLRRLRPLLLLHRILHRVLDRALFLLLLRREPPLRTGRAHRRRILHEEVEQQPPLGVARHGEAEQRGDRRSHVDHPRLLRAPSYPASGGPHDPARRARNGTSRSAAEVPPARRGRGGRGRTARAAWWARRIAIVDLIDRFLQERDLGIDGERVRLRRRRTNRH